MASQMNIRYLHTNDPSDEVPDGNQYFNVKHYSYNIIYYIQEGFSQIDIRYSNIKRPSDSFTDGYTIFEYQTSI